MSTDGRGRALDNVIVERLWGTVEYEGIHLQGYDEAPAELEAVLYRYSRSYNEQQPHTALDRRTLAEVHWTFQPTP